MKKNLKALNFLILIIFFTNIFPLTIKAKENKLNVDARCAIAIDTKSKIVLYEKNGYDVVPMASTTKIMTSLVAVKYGNLDKKVQISQKAASIRGSVVGYKKGELVSLKELLYGLMLRSGNDAAIAISEGVSGSVEEFVKVMNEYADEIGVVNTHFHTPHGLDYDDHYTTAYDLAIATSKAKENPLFEKIVSSKDVDGKTEGFTRSYHNINKILWQVPEANGVKTGYTGKAGKCLVSSANIKGNDVIVVVLNCTERWRETKKIYDFTEKNYNFKKMFSKNQCVDKLSIGNESIDLLCKNDIIIPTKNGVKYEVKIVKPEKINSSMKKGSKLGKVCIYNDKEMVYEDDLVSNKDYKLNKFLRFFNK